MKNANKSATSKVNAKLDEKQKLIVRIVELDPKADKVILTAKSRESLRAILKNKTNIAAQKPAAPIVTKTKPTPKNQTARTKSVTPPAPAPVTPAAPVAPAPAQTPAEIELAREGVTGKRYVSKTAPDSKYHLRDRSEAEKPVSVVRAICDKNKKKTRKQIIDLCLAKGVNKNTAATQYSLWKAKQAEAGEDETSAE